MQRRVVGTDGWHRLQITKSEHCLKSVQLDGKPHFKTQTHNLVTPIISKLKFCSLSQNLLVHACVAGYPGHMTVPFISPSERHPAAPYLT
jgi:hypothetical protein